jgi:hypothetical protein
MQEAFDHLDAPVINLTGKDVPMPYAANLEKLALVTTAEVDRGGPAPPHVRTFGAHVARYGVDPFEKLRAGNPADDRTGLVARRDVDHAGGLAEPLPVQGQPVGPAMGDEDGRGAVAEGFGHGRDPGDQDRRVRDRSLGGQAELARRLRPAHEGEVDMIEREGRQAPDAGPASHDRDAVARFEILVPEQASDSEKHAVGGQICMVREHLVPEPGVHVVTEVSVLDMTVAQLHLNRSSWSQAGTLHSLDLGIAAERTSHRRQAATVVVTVMVSPVERDRTRPVPPVKQGGARRPQSPSTLDDIAASCIGNIPAPPRVRGQIAEHDPIERRGADCILRGLPDAPLGRLPIEVVT